MEEERRDGKKKRKEKKRKKKKKKKKKKKVRQASDIMTNGKRGHSLNELGLAASCIVVLVVRTQW